MLDAADDEYRALFLDRVNAFLDKASPKIFDPLPAIERLKWHLVRRRLLPELLEVLRFQKEDLSSTPPVRVRGKWYGDYPFRTDRELEIPSSIYRVEPESTCGRRSSELERRGDEAARARLRVHPRRRRRGRRTPSTCASTRCGRAACGACGCSRRRSGCAAQRRATRAHAATSRQALTDLSWAGFEATLDPRALRRRAALARGHAGSCT